MNKPGNLIKMLLAICLFAALSVNVHARLHINPDRQKLPVSIDTVTINTFIRNYPLYKPYQAEIKMLYQKYRQPIWIRSDGISALAVTFHDLAKKIEAEGLPGCVPYLDKIDILFNDGTHQAGTEDELLLSGLYCYYIQKVFYGLPDGVSRKNGWQRKRKTVTLLALLDGLLKNPAMLQQRKDKMFGQYAWLKEALRKYREIEKKGGWNPIPINKPAKIKMGNSSPLAAAVRHRLYIEGYLLSDSGNEAFDEQLLAAVTNYQLSHNHQADSIISPKLIESLNIPVADRIKSIVVNMERCRWITPSESKEFIIVNIPSYRLLYFRSGKPFLTSKVVVGRVSNKTVVFEADMNQLVFSPYWNIPNSILTKEILPELRDHPQLFTQHRLEWNNGRMRQKPGSGNALGLVKFLFPNPYSIYLHDTPQKKLFDDNERAFSHGCMRVEKARELAIAIMKKEQNWSEQQTDAAMHAGKQLVYSLKEKIPVYIAYFTAWSDQAGNVSFFNDIYSRDNSIYNALHTGN